MFGTFDVTSRESQGKRSKRMMHVPVRRIEPIKEVGMDECFEYSTRDMLKGMTLHNVRYLGGLHGQILS